MGNIAEGGRLATTCAKFNCGDGNRGRYDTPPHAAGQESGGGQQKCLSADFLTSLGLFDDYSEFGLALV